MSENYIPVIDLFNIYTANSKSIVEYSSGCIPFVSNGFYNNGVLGYVDPYPSDRVFKGGTISVSAFCEAVVQKEDYLPRGNGGSGLIVLEPKANMDYLRLNGYAAIINNALKWKYSYGRMVTKGRFSKESIPNTDFSCIIPPNVNDIIASIEKKQKILKCEIASPLCRIPITDIFDLQHGSFHSIEALSIGSLPTVSRIDSNNGVVGLYDAPDDAEVFKSLTITVSTVSGDTFVQLENFIATDNVVICKPKIKLKTETVFFIALSLNLEKWRWSYGRQCYKNKFAKTEIYLPMQNGCIDELAIKKFITRQWGWNYIKQFSKC